MGVIFIYSMMKAIRCNAATKRLLQNDKIRPFIKQLLNMLLLRLHIDFGVVCSVRSCCVHCEACYMLYTRECLDKAKLCVKEFLDRMQSDSNVI